MIKANYEEILKNIDEPLDKLVKTLIERPDPELQNLFDIPDALYQPQLLLAQHYNNLPFEEAQRRKERIEVISYVVRDLLERKRLEEIVKWRKGE